MLLTYALKIMLFVLHRECFGLECVWSAGYMYTLYCLFWFQENSKKIIIFFNPSLSIKDNDFKLQYQYNVHLAPQC